VTQVDADGLSVRAEDGTEHRYAADTVLWTAGVVVWLFIHIGFLTGYRSRLGAVLSWWLAFTRDLRRERTFTTREVGVGARRVHRPARSLPTQVSSGPAS
jgi:hypothetical protein